MRFKTYTSLKYISLLPALGGILLLIYVLTHFNERTEEEQINLVRILIIIPTLLFVASYFALRGYKTIERQNNKWIIYYPYKRKTITITTENIWRATIDRRTHTGIYRIGKNIFLKTKQGQIITINSMELADFSKLEELIIMDFKNIVTISESTFG